MQISRGCRTKCLISRYLVVTVAAPAPMRRGRLMLLQKRHLFRMHAQRQVHRPRTRGVVVILVINLLNGFVYEFFQLYFFVSGLNKLLSLGILFIIMPAALFT